MSANRKTLLTRIVTPGGDDPLLLRLVAPKVVRTGSAVSGIALVGQGGAGGYAYSILTGSAYGSLPPGLTLNANGTITGTPTTVGHYAFVAQVQDADSSVYTATFSLLIQSRLVKVLAKIPAGQVGSPYIFTFRVTGNTGVVTWTIESGNLPAGLSLNSSTGTVSGTPTADSNGLGGTSYFTIRASDSGTGEYLDIPASIIVHEEFSYPGTLGITISATIPFEFDPKGSYIGGVQPIMYSARIPDGHEWLTYNRQTNVLEGTPSLGDVSSTPFTVSFSATDAIGKTAGGSIDITVGPPPQGSIQLKEDGADVGPLGPINFDFVGDGVSVANDGLTTTITIPGGGGGGSVASVGGALPDSSGNVGVYSPDASVGVGVDSSGQLTLTSNASASVAGSINIDFGPEHGNAGAILSTQQRTLFVPSDYVLTAWLLKVTPDADVEVDIRYSDFPDDPDASDSITDGNPLVTTAAGSSSGTTALWAVNSAGDVSISRGNRLGVAIVSNDVAVSVSVQLQGMHS